MSCRPVSGSCAGFLGCCRCTFSTRSLMEGALLRPIKVGPCGSEADHKIWIRARFDETAFLAGEWVVYGFLVLGSKIYSSNLLESGVRRQKSNCSLSQLTFAPGSSNSVPCWACYLTGVKSPPSTASSAAHRFLLPRVWKPRTCQLLRTKSSNQLVRAFGSRLVAVFAKLLAKGFRYGLSFEKLCGFVGER